MKTGSPMGGSIEDTRRAKAIPCNCPKCFHAKIRAGVLYCTHYDLIKPDKKTCARFRDVKGKFLGPKQRKPPKKQGPQR